MVSATQHLQPYIKTAVVLSLACGGMVEPWEALIIGMIGSMLGLAGKQLLRIVHIDDPVGKCIYICFHQFINDTLPL